MYKDTKYIPSPEQDLTTEIRTLSAICYTVGHKILMKEKMMNLTNQLNSYNFTLSNIHKCS